MKLFEQRFKQYLTEGSQFGYNMKDEDTFLGWDIDDNVRKEFPNVYDHLKTVLDTYDRSPGSAADVQDLVTISALRDVVDEEEVNNFVEYAENLTSVNSQFLNLLEEYGIGWSHLDFDGVEAYHDMEDGQDNEQLRKELSFVFDEKIPEDWNEFDSVRLSMTHEYENGEFTPRLLVGLQDNEDGSAYDLTVDSSEASYYMEFDMILDQLKEMGLFE